MLDTKALATATAAIIREHVDKTVAPLLDRLDAMEKRMGELSAAPSFHEVAKRMADELDAIRAAVDAIQPAPELPDIDSMVKSAVSEAVAAIPAPQDGKDGASVTVADVRPLIEAEVRAKFEEIPVPKDGRDGIDGKDGGDGRSVTIDDVAPMIVAEVEKRVSELPRPKDGTDGKDGADGASIDPVEVERMVAEQVEKAVSATPVPKDGADGKDGLDAVQFIRDANDHVIVTMSDGSTRDLGEFKAKDGAPGKDGKDGVDGLGFEDMTEELADDGRTIIRRYVRGDQVKEFRHSLAVVLDRGVYSEGSEYKAGDGVTWAGSFWIAQKDTSTKPDSGDGWRLAVKRGRDGKPGRDGRAASPPAPVKL